MQMTSSGRPGAGSPGTSTLVDLGRMTVAGRQIGGMQRHRDRPSSAAAIHKNGTPATMAGQYETKILSAWQGQNENSMALAVRHRMRWAGHRGITHWAASRVHASRVLTSAERERSGQLMGGSVGKAAEYDRPGRRGNIVRNRNRFGDRPAVDHEVHSLTQIRPQK